MDWVKTLAPLLQTGIKMYAAGQFVKHSAEHAKDVAVRSSVIAFGVLGFLIFLIAAVILVFVDLGRQWEGGRELYWSGYMMSALALTGLGVFVLGVCLIASKLIARSERTRPTASPGAENPYGPLLQFGEEFLKQLILNLEQKNAAAKASVSASAEPAKREPPA